LSATLALALLLATSLVYADGRRGKHHGNPAERMAKLSQKLDLSQEQQASVRQILNGQREKGREIRQSMREQAKPQFEALREETRSKLATVLDEEQLQKYDALRAKKHKKMKKRWRKHRDSE
ncbi:MAG: periplasmic heavy metal sensor, partial [Gammaproteobacteria bacterium]